MRIETFLNDPNKAQYTVLDFYEENIKLLNEQDFNDFCNAIAECTALKKLKLANTGITSNQIAVLLSTILDPQISLDLSENSFDTTDLVIIGEALKDSEVEYLQLRTNQKLEPAGIHALMSAIETSKVSKLDLRYNCLSIHFDEFVELLHCSQLTELQLGDTDLSSKQILLLAEALKSTSITNLDLSENYCNITVLTKLIELLQETQVTSLDIRGMITPFEIIFLEEALSASKITKILYLPTVDSEDEQTEEWEEDPIFNDVVFSEDISLVNKLETAFLDLGYKEKIAALLSMSKMNHKFNWSDLSTNFRNALKSFFCSQAPTLESQEFMQGLTALFNIGLNEKDLALEERASLLAVFFGDLYNASKLNSLDIVLKFSLNWVQLEPDFQEALQAKLSEDSRWWNRQTIDDNLKAMHEIGLNWELLTPKFKEALNLTIAPEKLIEFKLFTNSEEIDYIPFTKTMNNLSLSPHKRLGSPIMFSSPIKKLKESSEVEFHSRSTSIVDDIDERSSSPISMRST